MTTATVQIIQALDTLTEEIRKYHPEAPEVVLVVGATGVKGRTQVHGHYAAKAWHGDKHELFLSGESLGRGAVATLGTLLHEFAHAIGDVRDIRTTSNGNRYHNKKFKLIGEELGIELDTAPTLGWSVTSVPESTQARYADGLEKLADALTTWREPKLDAKEKKPTKKNTVKVHCECDDGTTVSKKFWEAHQSSLKCDDCLTDFVANEENR